MKPTQTLWSTLLCTALLSACGGGTSTPTASTPPVTEAPLTDLGQAPATLRDAQGSLSAALWAVSASTQTSVPADAQAGTVLVLNRDSAGTAQGLTLKKIRYQTGGQTTDLAVNLPVGWTEATEPTPVVPPAGAAPSVPPAAPAPAVLFAQQDPAARQWMVFFTTPLSATQMAVQLEDRQGRTFWLAAPLQSAQRGYRPYASANSLPAASSPEAPPILQVDQDWSGMTAVVATLLREGGMAISPVQVFNGLLTYGDTASILQRRSFSLLDLNLFLSQLGLKGYGYVSNDLWTDLGNALGQSSQKIILPLQLHGVTQYVLADRRDDQWLYVRSPLFGPLAIARDTLPGLLPPPPANVPPGAVVFVVDLKPVPPVVNLPSGPENPLPSCWGNLKFC